MRRPIVVAIFAIVVVAAAAVAAWLALVHATAVGVATQARLAVELLDADARIDERLARSLQRTGVRVHLADRSAGYAIDADERGIDVRALPGPPPGAEPPLPGERPLSAAVSPNEPPPREAGAPPPADGPNGGPREAGAPGRPPGPPPFGRRNGGGPLTPIVLAIVHIEPTHFVRGFRVADVSPDGRYLTRWFSIIVGTFVAGSLGIIGVAVSRETARGRADRRRLEATSEERREAAERYQRFLAETGHELRTPLTVMSGYVEILRRHEAGNAIDPRIIDGMHAENTRMRVLVEKILTLARLDTTAAVPRLLDVASAANDAAETLRRRFADRSVAVDAGASGSIVIDADDYAAAVGNLLENAIKYAPGSPIVVATDVREGRATTSVIDQGPGIAPEDRSAIFERFYRGRGGERGDGLGIGLAIVKRVADRWNGRVDLESGPGRTVFSLSFPLADEEPHAVPG